MTDIKIAKAKLKTATKSFETENGHQSNEKRARVVKLW